MVELQNFLFVLCFETGVKSNRPRFIIGALETQRRENSVERTWLCKVGFRPRVSGALTEHRTVVKH